MSRSCPESVVHAWVQLVRAKQVVFAAIEHELKVAGFPPLSWYDILLELSAAEGNRLKAYEIERRTLLTQYNLSRLLDRLEREGLIERKTCPEDGRSRWILLTASGRALRRKMWPAYAAAINRHMGAKLNPAAAVELTALLKSLSGSTADKTATSDGHAE